VESFFRPLAKKKKEKRKQKTEKRKKKEKKTPERTIFQSCAVFQK
jgi:hypothetical protein